MKNINNQQEGIQSEKTSTKYLVGEAIKYVQKYFKKPAVYEQVYKKYDKWGEKAQKEMMKGKYKSKTLYHWGNLETVIALCEYLNAPTTEHINSKLLDKNFLAQFGAYQKNKIFDRNKQPRPEDVLSDEEIEEKTHDYNTMI